MDKILELKCNECIKHELQNLFIATLTDFAGSRIYKINIYDRIPINSIIRINTFHHELHNQDDFLMIKVKQKFDYENQPELVEVIAINYIESPNGGMVATLRDTNTSDNYKIKMIGDSKGLVNKPFVINLRKDNKTIVTVPHYFDTYTIENWIFEDNTIKVL